MGSVGRNKADAVLEKSWYLKVLPKRFIDEVVEVVKNTKKLAQDDPRRVTHSLKVGLTLTLVSLFYYFQPLYDNFGVSAMWAVITVVVVCEFTVGATLGKGLNRAMATLLAGGLGVGAHHLASLCGKLGEPILIGLFVFLQAAASTFIRFFPKVKARYDYGFVIFILTFCFISITGFREDEILELAHKRLSAIVIGGFASLLISMFVYPVWAGEDLHNLVALNIEKLGNFLEGFGVAYFEISEAGVDKDDKVILQGYRSVLNSKNIEETLATKKTRDEIHEACITMSSESGQALKELASALRTMTQSPSSVDAHIASMKAGVKSLKSFLGSSIWGDSKNVDLLKVMMPVATVASLLIDIVECTEKIAEAVHDLASLAHFKMIESTVSPEMKSPVGFTASQNAQNPITPSNSREDCPQVAIVVGELCASSNTGKVNPVEEMNAQHAEV
ncbi:hypothetical protein Ancab_007482 [Ancistrocladus abbreviatus]